MRYRFALIYVFCSSRESRQHIFHPVLLHTTQVKVAIFDTGIDLNHRHFAHISDRSEWTDENMLDDRLGHGTFVAGVVASNNPACHGFADQVSSFSLCRLTAVSHPFFFGCCFVFLSIWIESTREKAGGLVPLSAKERSLKNAAVGSASRNQGRPDEKLGEPRLGTRRDLPRVTEVLCIMAPRSHNSPVGDACVMSALCRWRSVCDGSVSRG